MYDLFNIFGCCQKVLSKVNFTLGNTIILCLYLLNKYM